MEVLSWEYQDTKARRIVLEEREERIKEQLVQLCNNQPSVGAGIRLQKILKKGTVEYKKIPELKGVDLEKYRRDPTEYWKISDC